MIRAAGAPAVVETPGGVEGQSADIALLRRERAAEPSEGSGRPGTAAADAAPARDAADRRPAGAPRARGRRLGRRPTAPDSKRRRRRLRQPTAPGGGEVHKRATTGTARKAEDAHAGRPAPRPIPGPPSRHRGRAPAGSAAGSARSPGAPRVRPGHARRPAARRRADLADPAVSAAHLAAGHLATRPARPGRSPGAGTSCSPTRQAVAVQRVLPASRTASRSATACSATRRPACSATARWPPSLRYNILFVLAHALLLIGAYALVRQFGAGRTGAAVGRGRLRLRAVAARPGGPPRHRLGRRHPARPGHAGPRTRLVDAVRLPARPSPRRLGRGRAGWSPPGRSVSVSRSACRSRTCSARSCWSCWSRCRSAGCAPARPSARCSAGGCWSPT